MTSARSRVDIDIYLLDRSLLFQPEPYSLPADILKTLLYALKILQK